MSEPGGPAGRRVVRLHILPFLLLLLAGAAPVQARPSRLAIGAPAPAFSLPLRVGTVSSDSLRGKVVLIDFWASWCGPCRLSFPWLASLHQRYGDKGLAIVAVDLDKERAAADEFLTRYPAPFRVAFDPAGRSAEAFGVAVMPSSFLIGPTGTLLCAHAGFDPKRTAALEALIQEACAR